MKKQILFFIVSFASVLVQANPYKIECTGRYSNSGNIVPRSGYEDSVSLYRQSPQSWLVNGNRYIDAGADQSSDGRFLRLNTYNRLLCRGVQAEYDLVEKALKIRYLTSAPHGGCAKFEGIFTNCVEKEILW